MTEVATVCPVRDTFLEQLHDEWLGVRWGVGGQRHAPAALPPEEDPVPIV